MNATGSNSQPHSNLILRTTLCLVLGCLIAQQKVHGQAAQNGSGELDTAIARARSGEVSPRDVVVIADAGAVEAVPALEAQFKRATDISKKTSIASGLVRLGERDETYWKFLLDQATMAVESEVPDAVFSESQGKMMNHSPELEVWAAGHNLAIKTASQYARFDIPGKVLQLARTGDPRGIPLLRRALLSHNYLVVSLAAEGLTQIQDRQSIPLIIAAARSAPAGYSSLIAESLVYFDDPQAQSAVDSYMPKEKARLARQERARGRGVFGW